MGMRAGAILLVVVVGMLSCLLVPTQAQGVRIVALGASNTAGKGVSPSQAWPAQLQAMLQARGHNVQVVNAGISGDDTSRMLARVGSAVPSGTQIVILDKAGDNDRRRGINTDANVAAISSQLQRRGIKTIVIPGMHGWAGRQLQADGIHITAQGHTAVANRLLPLVVQAMGKK